MEREVSRHVESEGGQLGSIHRVGFTSSSRTDEYTLTTVHGKSQKSFHENIFRNTRSFAHAVTHDASEIEILRVARVAR